MIRLIIIINYYHYITNYKSPSYFASFVKKDKMQKKTKISKEKGGKKGNKLEAGRIKNR